MAVAEAPFSTPQQVDFLAVFGDLAEEFARIGVENGSAYGYVDNLILAILAVASAGASRFAVGGEDVAAIAEWKECPHVGIAPEDDVPAAAAVAPVGATFGYILGAVEVAASGASLAGAAKDLHIIYKIRIGHICLSLFI